MTMIFGSSVYQKKVIVIIISAISALQFSSDIVSALGETNNTRNNVSAEKVESATEKTLMSFDEMMFLSPEDSNILEEWGGNCTLADWDNCKVKKAWFGYYVNPKYADGGNETKWLHFELDCKLEPPLCMNNGWTVNRCHILCMGHCNKEMLYKFDKYMNHQGECKAHG